METGYRLARRRWSATGGLPNLPNGLLRSVRTQHGGSERSLSIQLERRIQLPTEFIEPSIAVDSLIVDRRVRFDRAALDPSGEPCVCRVSPVHVRARRGARAVYRPTGWGLHARPD